MAGAGLCRWVPLSTGAPVPSRAFRARLYLTGRSHPIVTAVLEADGFEVSFAALDLLPLDFGDLQPARGALGFAHQIHFVLAVLVLPDNGPIRIVSAQRRLNFEPVRQLEEQFDVLSGVQCLG